MVMNPASFLRAALPSVGTITDALIAIRAGELRGLAPGLGSVREFARTIGVNESTLRSAFLTPGRRASERTIARVDAAIRSNMTLLGRQVRANTILDAGWAVENPLSRHYLTAPPNARSFRIIAKSADPDYEYATFFSGTAEVDDPLDLAQDLPPGWDLEAVVWDVS